eukprot:7342122-Heterocapsa_arctica.AAC.1
MYVSRSPLAQALWLKPFWLKPLAQGGASCASLAPPLSRGPSHEGPLMPASLARHIAAQPGPSPCGPSGGLARGVTSGGGNTPAQAATTA